MEFQVTKSKYCTAVQCPKKLWLEENKPEAFVPPAKTPPHTKAGIEFGILARGVFGAYAEVPLGTSAEMTGQTARLMAAGESVIAEATFSYGNLLCRVDILKNLGAGQVELYEVKSSCGDDLKVKKKKRNQHLDDIAFQYYVLTKLGYIVRRACVVYPNKEYVRAGELELGKLLAFRDITQEAADEMAQVAENIQRINLCMQQMQEPDLPICNHCNKSDLCGFFGHCSKIEDRPCVFNIAGLKYADKLALYRRGKVYFSDLAQDDLADKYWLQVAHEVHDLPAHIDVSKISVFLDKLRYPIYFLDFESFQSLIPIYDGTFSNQQIIFQYSLHYIAEAGGELKHAEFLGDPRQNPHRALAEQLCRNIPRDACVTAYSKGTERSYIKALANLFEDLRDHLMSIHDNILDLADPFRDKDYYTRNMQGLYSIKYVLPALFPDDPDLDYHNLEGVHNGAEAPVAYLEMASKSPEEAEIVRKQLLNYCRLDTFAMVKVWEKLHQVTGRELKVTW